MNEPIEFMIEYLRSACVDEMQKWKDIQSSDKASKYLFHSREALIADYGLDYVKQMIEKFESSRHALKTYGKPKDEFDMLEIWILKFNVAWSTRFAMSSYYE